jgi:glycolate oxidase FAD binding subunit
LASVSSLAEASTLLATAGATGRHVRIGADLRLDGMGRILEHEAGDLTCTVEAGIRLSALQAALAPAGQRLSLDPPGDPTVGGLLAGNLSGPLRYRFGAPRDLVLGVTLVLADGTVANSGGKVVKNVAGYDLARLVCGSLGKLALIARASLRLHPLPASTRTLVVETDDVPGVVSRLQASQLEASALDVLHPGRVVVRFEGSPGAVEAQFALARLLVGGDPGDEDVWGQARARQGAARGRIRFSPGRLGEALDGISEAVVRPSAGIAYVPYETPTDLHPGVVGLVEALRGELDPQGVLA